VIALGRRRACFGVRIRVIGFVAVMPRFSSHLWKERSVAILRAIVAGE